jgi:hypothetical protein
LYPEPFQEYVQFIHMDDLVNIFPVVYEIVLPAQFSIL